jgi:hypothetical protein
MLSFFFFFLSPPPGGFLSTTRFHKRKTQNGELLLTRVFAQIAFRKPKNKRGKQSLSTFQKHVRDPAAKDERGDR